MGVILFIPLVPWFTRFLQKLFPEKSTVLGLSVEHVDPEVPEAALVAIKKDSIKLLKKVFKYIMNVWSVDEQSLLHNHDVSTLLAEQVVFDEQVLDRQYKMIKTIEENLISFGAHIKRHTHKISYDEEISSLYHIVSVSVYAAKYMKDIRENIVSLEEDDKSWLYNQYQIFRMDLVKLYIAISEIINGQYSDEIVKEMITLVGDIKEADNRFLSSLSKDISKQKLDQYDLSDVLHINRYVYLSSLSIIEAVKDLLLTPEEKKIFEQLQ